MRFLKRSLSGLLVAFAACAVEVGSEQEYQGDLETTESALVGKGQICVAPIGKGSTTCVASGGDVSVAYRGAQASCGSCNYDMWPQFPSGMTFDKGVRNSGAIKQLQADVDSILAFAKTQNAEAYAATLGGKLSEVLHGIQQAQAAVIEQPDPRVTAPLEHFETRLRQMQQAEEDPVVADLATKKKFTGEILAIVQDYTARFATSQSDYAALVTRYKTYKATEAKLISDLQNFSKRASAASLTTLPKVQLDLLAYINKAAATPDQFTLDATRVVATMEQLEAAFKLRLEAYGTFIATNFGTAPELSVVAQRSLNNMIAYCELRCAQTDAQVAALFRGMSARRDALVEQAADAETRATLQEEAFLKASGEFLDEATARASEISTVPPKTTKYGYTLWADKYDQYIAFLQLESLCGSANDPARPSWRDAGCVSFSRSFGRARTYTTSTIPQMIHLTLSQLRTKGVAESILTEIDSFITQGRIREAALRYDAAARLTETM